MVHGGSHHSLPRMAAVSPLPYSRCVRSFRRFLRQVRALSGQLERDGTGGVPVRRLSFLEDREHSIAATSTRPPLESLLAELAYPLDFPYSTSVEAPHICPAQEKLALISASELGLLALETTTKALFLLETEAWGMISR